MWIVWTLYIICSIANSTGETSINGGYLRTYNDTALLSLEVIYSHVNCVFITQCVTGLVYSDAWRKLLAPATGDDALSEFAQEVGNRPTICMNVGVRPVGLWRLLPSVVGGNCLLCALEATSGGVNTLSQSAPELPHIDKSGTGSQC